MSRPATSVHIVLSAALLLLVAVAVLVQAGAVKAATCPMVAAGNSHTVGLKSDATVVAVGNNVCGQWDVGSLACQPKFLKSSVAIVRLSTIRYTCRLEFERLW